VRSSRGLGDGSGSGRRKFMRRRLGKGNGSRLRVVWVVGGFDRISAMSGNPSHAGYHFALSESAGLVGADIWK